MQLPQARQPLSAAARPYRERRLLGCTPREKRRILATGLKFSPRMSDNSFDLMNFAG